MQKLNSDEAFKACAEAFFPLAIAAAELDAAAIKFPPINGVGIRYMHGVHFEISPEIQSAENRLVNQTVKLLGSKDGNEKEITEIAWQIVLQSVQRQEQTNDTKVIKDRFIEKISNNNARKFVYVCPNYTMRFDEESIDKIVVGPVQAVLSSKLAPTFFKKNKKIDWSAVAGDKFSNDYKSKKMTLSPVIWRVEVKAAQANVPEEANWLINIALSLIRFSCESRSHYFPFYGDREAMPTTPPIFESNHVIIEGTHFYGGGLSGPNLYTVDTALAKTLRSRRFKNCCKAIFAPGKKTLGLRVGQGLGWLTRARQTDDRAERFLYFFTAIEALLSSSDNSAPIVQTVARNAATILSDDPHERSKIVKTVKSLYQTRSILVHAGAKNVSNNDVNTLQSIAEQLFRAVMEKVPLDQGFKEFQENLNIAGYGLKWP